MRTLRQELVRANDIRRTRARSARGGVVAMVVQAQLLFWSWVIGWSLGPSPITPTELAAGGLFSFALGAAFGFPFMRTRVETGVRQIIKLREGRRTRRFAFFEEYLTIGDEIILRDSIGGAEVVAGALKLAYERTTDGLSIERSFTGKPRALSAADTEFNA